MENLSRKAGLGGNFNLALLTTMDKSTRSIKSQHGNNSVKEEKQGQKTSDLETIMAKGPADSSYGNC